MRTTALILPIVVGCSSTPMSHDHAAQDHRHADHAFTDAASWSKVFDDPARDAWQKPDDIINAMALTPTMTVADVGAGTGYFAMRLSRVVSGGEVIATDIEPDMVKHLTERARNHNVNNLRAVLAQPSSSGLAAQSVDRILVVHVWHHLNDRVAYARDLAAALRPGGKLFIVDFSMTAKHGPPMAMRLPPEAIMAELKSAGMAAQLTSLSIDDQIIIEAHRE